MSELRQPVWLKAEEVPKLPDGWLALPTEEACVQLKPGKLYETKTVSNIGKVPVINQSLSEFLGFHNDEPGVHASPECPVVTFANHTCAMRLMKHPFSSIQNVFPKIGKPGVTDTIYFYYASLGRVGLSDYKGHHPIFRKAFIPIPPLPEQKCIAGILSAYDELIDNSQRRIKVLEAMARNLYREWFVHFRYPGHQNTPLIPSSLGDIPKGWEVKKLGEIMELNYGKSLKKEDRRDGKFPVYGSSGIVGTHDSKLVEGPGIIVGRKGNVGSVFWCDDDFYVIDTAYFVTSSLPLRFLFYVLPTLNFINSDAAVPGLSRNQAYTLDILVPSSDLLTRFCELADTFETQVATLQRQIQNLRKTRDLLLPRLLSGQIPLHTPTPKPHDKTHL
jgi:restriction endonuclease S subunit